MLFEFTQCAGPLAWRVLRPAPIGVAPQRGPISCGARGPVTVNGPVCAHGAWTMARRCLVRGAADGASHLAARSVATARSTAHTFGELAA